MWGPAVIFKIAHVVAKSINKWLIFDGLNRFTFMMAVSGQPEPVLVDTSAIYYRILLQCGSFI